VAPVLLLVIAATGAFAQRQTSQPPRELHRVGDHWTAWNPPDPASYPPGARTHTIKSGDTLWSLAQQYFNNPYLWPQLWESNTWIEDAHWIYPGDVLLVEGEGTTAAAEAAGQGETALSAVTPRDESSIFATEQEGSGIPTARMVTENRPIALGTDSDSYCYGTIGDLVYVSGGASTGLAAGESYLIVEPTQMVKHPADGRTLGREYRYIGQLRILCTEDGRSRAIITETCREIPLGARLKPIPQLPIPIARVPDPAAWCDGPTGKTTGYIVSSREWHLGLVEGNLLQIDLGSDNALQPGDFLTVTRPSTLRDQPPMILGQIGVLTTEARTATAIVLHARREMLIGDIVELR
jgi:hypothetical protein